MAIDREELHKIIDSLPSDKLPGVADLLKRIYDEDEELLLSSDEYQEVVDAEKRIANGEYITLDELLQKYGED